MKKKNIKQEDSDHAELDEDLLEKDTNGNHREPNISNNAISL